MIDIEEKINEMKENIKEAEMNEKHKLNEILDAFITASHFDTLIAIILNSTRLDYSKQRLTLADDRAIIGYIEAIQPEFCNLRFKTLHEIWQKEKKELEQFKLEQLKMEEANKNDDPQDDNYDEHYSYRLEFERLLKKYGLNKENYMLTYNLNEESTNMDYYYASIGLLKEIED